MALKYFQEDLKLSYDFILYFPIHQANDIHTSTSPITVILVLNSS